ncbi:unnamed protein product [Urochloa humidicola]
MESPLCLRPGVTHFFFALLFLGFAARRSRVRRSSSPMRRDSHKIQVLNKIDLPGAEPDHVAQEIEEIIGLDCSDAIRCSPKEGIGIIEILDALVTKIPPPKDTSKDPLRALIFDSYYDPYRGVIVYFRVIDRSIKKGDKICFMANGKEYVADEIGVLSPNQMQVDELYAGEGSLLDRKSENAAAMIKLLYKHWPDQKKPFVKDELQKLIAEWPTEVVKEAEER